MSSANFTLSTKPQQGADYKKIKRKARGIFFITVLPMIMILKWRQVSNA